MWGSKGMGLESRTVKASVGARCPWCVGCMTSTIWASGVRAIHTRLCRRSRHGRLLQGRTCLQGRRAAATERGPGGIAPLSHAWRQRRLRLRWQWLPLLPHAAPLALCACAAVRFLLRRHQGVCVGSEGAARVGLERLAHTGVGVWGLTIGGAVMCVYWV